MPTGRRGDVQLYVDGLDTDELRLARRELSVSLALCTDGSGLRTIIDDAMATVDAEIARREAESFVGRSILDLEAERVQLEEELDRLNAQDPDIAEAKRRLDAVIEEITRAGHCG